MRVVVRGAEPDAWVAESGFVVRRVGLESGKTKQLFRGHGGPVTSLAFHSSNGRELLVSGSWDKSFRVWDVQVRPRFGALRTSAQTDTLRTAADQNAPLDDGRPRRLC